MMCLTGLRKEEVLQLEWKKVDLIGKTLTFLYTKNGGDLYLPISGYLHDILNNRPINSAYVFPGRDQKKSIVENRKVIKKIYDMTGIKFTHHDSRLR